MYVIEEPLADLDSVAIEDVLITLTYLVVSVGDGIKQRNQGACVVCSMHTIPSYFLDYFDRVLLLAQGREVFFGSPSELRSFFFNSSSSAESHSETLIFEIMRQCSFSVYDSLRMQRQQEVDLSSLILKYEFLVLMFAFHVDLHRCMRRIESLLGSATTHLSPNPSPNSSPNPK